MYAIASALTFAFNTNRDEKKNTKTIFRVVVRLLSLLVLSCAHLPRFEHRSRQLIY